MQPLQNSLQIYVVLYLAILPLNMLSRDCLLVLLAELLLELRDLSQGLFTQHLSEILKLYYYISARMRIIPLRNAIHSLRAVRLSNRNNLEWLKHNRTGGTITKRRVFRRKNTVQRLIGSREPHDTTIFGTGRRLFIRGFLYHRGCF